MLTLKTLLSGVKLTEILQSPLFWRRNWKPKLLKPRARLNEKKKREEKKTKNKKQKTGSETKSWKGILKI